MKILEKDGTEITNIDGASFNKASIKDGVIKNRFNELQISRISTSSIQIDTGQLIVSGFNIISEEINELKVTSSSSTQKYYVVGILSMTNNVPDFTFSTILASTPLKKDNLFKNKSNDGVYMIKLASFNSGTDITDLKREFELISGDSLTIAIEGKNNLEDLIVGGIYLQKVGGGA